MWASWQQPMKKWKQPSFRILLYVFSAVIFLCLITFRSVKGTIYCIVVPLALVSLLAYALMSILEIGLKVTTLPVVALGVGYRRGLRHLYSSPRFRGIYFGEEPMEEFGDVCTFLNSEEEGAMQTACKCTLSITGIGVIFTGINPCRGCCHMDLFTTQVFQARHGNPVDLYVSGQHAGGHTPPPGTGVAGLLRTSKKKTQGV